MLGEIESRVIDLAAKMPDYQTNIETKVRAIRLPLGRFTHSVTEIQKQLPNVAESATAPVDGAPGTKRAPQPAATPLPVRVVESSSR